MKVIGNEVYLTNQYNAGVKLLELFQPADVFVDFCRGIAKGSAILTTEHSPYATWVALMATKSADEGHLLRLQTE